MNQDELDLMHKLTAKFLPKIDDDLMKSLLLAMLLMSDRDSGEEFKSMIKQKLIEKL